MSKRARTVATILLFVAVVLLIVTAFVSDAYPDLGGVLFAIGLLTLLGALTSHVLGRYWAKGDLEDDARVTVLPFLRLIAQDVDPGAKVDIWLPLVSAVDQKRLMRKKKLKPSRGKLVQTTSRPPPAGSPYRSLTGPPSTWPSTAGISGSLIPTGLAAAPAS